MYISGSVFWSCNIKLVLLPFTLKKKVNSICGALCRYLAKGPIPEMVRKIPMLDTDLLPPPLVANIGGCIMRAAFNNEAVQSMFLCKNKKNHDFFQPLQYIS